MPSGCVHILTNSISTTTSRARAQQSMKGDKKIIEYLNKALRHELTAESLKQTKGGLDGIGRPRFVIL